MFDQSCYLNNNCVADGTEPLHLPGFRKSYVMGHRTSQNDVQALKFGPNVHTMMLLQKIRLFTNFNIFLPR